MQKKKTCLSELFLHKFILTTTIVYKAACSHIGIKIWVNDSLQGSLDRVVIAN